MGKYDVYVLLDSLGHIVAINSSAFIADVTGWIKIDEGIGDKYHHAHGNYLGKPLMDEQGIYRYKLVDSFPVELTSEELAAEANKLPQTPSQLDRIEAQVAYTAMMTSTLLEA